MGERLTEDEIQQWVEDDEYLTVQQMAEEYLALRRGLEPLRDHPLVGGIIRLLLDGDVPPQVAEIRPLDDDSGYQTYNLRGVPAAPPVEGEAET